MNQVLVLPAELDGHHVLAVPAGTDLLELAAAWFPAAEWERLPIAAAPASRPTGARFRGAVIEAMPGLPGAVRLDAATTIVGPCPVTGADSGLRAGAWDLYGLVPGPHQGSATAWMTAAAQRVGGTVASADRTRTLSPDPEAVVDLVVWSAQPMSAADAAAVVRPALSGARLPAPPAMVAGAAPQPFELTARFDYDGDVTVRLQRDAPQPAVLSTLDWREHGPWAYRISWVPLEPAELTVDDPSALHVIARQRVRPVVASAAAALARVVGGTAVDRGGFVVTPDELRDRAVRR